MDVLNEEEAMFESPLVDSYLTSPATVSPPPACYSTHSCRNQRGDCSSWAFFSPFSILQVVKASALNV